MAEAAQGHVQLDELQARANDELAAATGAEAGLVTAGAAAGLTLATAACLAGFDPARMDALPFVADGRNEIVVQRGHRNAYDHAIRAAGARFVEVGYLGYPGAGTTYPWQIEAAITERTVAVACPVMDTPGHRARWPRWPPSRIVTAARHRGRGGQPAAARQPAPLHPRGPTWSSSRAARRSAGRRAPGCSSGRRDLIESARLQMLDMDVYPQVWQAGARS
jgi:L-seryl-tRNA(Ser) seleniumtransferase